MEELTPRRKQILDFIRSFIGKRGYAPSVREIASGCGLSSLAIVLHHLNILEKEGYINRHREVSRSIELTESGLRRMTPVPLLGVIAAGEPIPVPEQDSWHIEAEEMVEVPGDMLPSNIQAFALRVRGNSMIDAYVVDGDIVILEATPAVENGQMAAAWLPEDNTATLKKVYYEPNRIRLQPANESMAPIYVDPDKVIVQGRVIAILRRYDLGFL